MEQPKEPTLENQVGKIRLDVEELAKTLKINPREALMLLMQRELVIANRQLTQLHEILEKKAKGEKRG